MACNDALAEAAEQWGGVVGLDTEFQRTDTYFPIPGLYQLSTASGVWLIDPLAIDDWTPLTRLLEDAGCVKVMHSCSRTWNCWAITWASAQPTFSIRSWPTPFFRSTTA